MTDSVSTRTKRQNLIFEVRKRKKNMASFPIRGGICVALSLVAWPPPASACPLMTLPVWCQPMVPSFTLHDRNRMSREKFANKGIWLYEIIYIDYNEKYIDYNEKYCTKSSKINIILLDISQIPLKKFRFTLERY